MPSTDYTPTLADVGALTRARTKNATGSELGTYTTDTRPTAAEATVLITAAVGAVSAEIGPDIDDRLFDLAKHVASLRAAMLIEVAYFPEQVAEGRSPYEQYRALYEESIAKLIKQSDTDTDVNRIATAAHMPSPFLEGWVAERATGRLPI